MTKSSGSNGHNPEYDIIGTKPRPMVKLALDDLFAPTISPVAPARASDPLTSKFGATDVLPRAGSQQFRLLEAFAAHPDGLIAEEAGTHASLSHTGYWKRVSDLLRDGLLEDTHTTRKSAAGSDQRILRITASGRRVVATKGVQ